VPDTIISSEVTIKNDMALTFVKVHSIREKRRKGGDPQI
jgi:hypothetical protein